MRSFRARPANSAAERTLGGVALGRGSGLLMGSSDDGARRAALHGLIETAKRNGPDPGMHLREVRKHVAEQPISGIDEPLSRDIGSTAEQRLVV